MNAALKNWLSRLHTPGDFLCLQAQQLAIWQTEGGAWRPVRTFADTAAGQAELAAYLHRRRTPLRLLVDSQDETYQHENLPPLSPADYRQYAERRLAEQFPDTPFRQAYRSARGDAVQYSALTDPAALLRWLDALQDQPLAGIYTVAQLCAALLTPLCRLLPGDAPATHQLLITAADPAGWYASYFVRGELRFAHRSHPADGSLPDEILRIRHYLHSQQGLPREQTLTVILLGCPPAGVPSDPGLMICPVELSQLGRAIAYPGKSDALLPLLLHRFRQQAPAGQFAPPALTRRFRLRLLRQSLYGLCGLLWLGSAAWSGSLLWQAAGLHAEAVTVTAQTARIRLPTPPELPLPVAELKSALAALPAADAPAESLLQGLSAALDDIPSIELTELSWNGHTLVLHARSEAGDDWPNFRRRLAHDYARISELQSPASPDGQTSVIWQLSPTGNPP